MVAKSCFLISPIGEPESELRKYANSVLDFLRHEVLLDDYSIVRSDENLTATTISDNMINQIIDSDLTIALLDGDNPNVYYEIAVRHSAGKACIAIVSNEYRKDHRMPFDISDVQEIRFPREPMNGYAVGNTLDGGLLKFKKDMRSAIQFSEEAGFPVLNPVIRAREDFKLPPRKTTEDLIRDVLNAWKADANNDLVKTIGEQVKKSSNDIAEYIDGEERAFKQLAKMTRQATTSLRTSRFAPQAISGTTSSIKSEFFNALCEFGSKKGVTCTRIMCMNEENKYDDLWKTITGTAGGSMELYLTKRTNNFELVVIDELYTFLHFYDDNTSRRIKSTLFIKDATVSREFERIYRHFLEDDEFKFYVIKCADCLEPDEQAREYENAKKKFPDSLKGRTV